MTAPTLVKVFVRLGLSSLALVMAGFVATWTIGHSVMEFSNSLGIQRLVPLGWGVTPNSVVVLRIGFLLGAVIAPFLLALLCLRSPKSPKIESALWIGVAVVSGFVYGALLTPRIAHEGAGVLIAILGWAGVFVYLWALRRKMPAYGALAAGLVLTGGVLWGFVFAVPIAQIGEVDCDGFTSVHEEISVAREFGVAPHFTKRRYRTLVRGGQWPGDTAALFVDATPRPARLFPPERFGRDWRYAPVGRCVYFADREAVRVPEVELRRRRLVP
ncbi:MAG: hypothetical protein AAF658_10350 [Myxococcota bacterium]